MNKRTLKRAIGVSNGKTLAVSNDCATVQITLETGHDDGRARYYVDGDTDLNRHFFTLEKALSYAVAQLALYMDGSPNR